MQEQMQSLQGQYLITHSLNQLKAKLQLLCSVLGQNQLQLRLTKIASLRFPYSVKDQTQLHHQTFWRKVRHQRSLKVLKHQTLKWSRKICLLTLVLNQMLTKKRIKNNHNLQLLLMLYFQNKSVSVHNLGIRQTLRAKNLLVLSILVSRQIKKKIKRMTKSRANSKRHLPRNR